MEMDRIRFTVRERRKLEGLAQTMAYFKGVRETGSPSSREWARRKYFESYSMKYDLIAAASLRTRQQDEREALSLLQTLQDMKLGLCDPCERIENEITGRVEELLRKWEWARKGSFWYQKSDEKFISFSNETASIEPIWIPSRKEIRIGTQVPTWELHKQLPGWVTACLFD